ncbi:hypothetical protein CMQ_8302 [Grosmannia clavigera kw1407]|uniref:Uncharacterized protein n=1 Tax=Grosmannia clavigera (strain kw1407 / UAMH 11150) TaxID=655863 RepID=F0XKM8_GROCL|nr:uncharacterized protein CMQ_8302 [Grosmannia clavigera kw1407]EFX01836.1 hypothetical protein CMQ_8302 [Grosmannia clavigera kw1407]
MQITHILSIALAAMLSTPVLACKCQVGGSEDVARTQDCCGRLNGVFRYGNDCEASSISQHLSNFRSCCGGQSDCDY